MREFKTIKGNIDRVKSSLNEIKEFGDVIVSKKQSTDQMYESMKSQYDIQDVSALENLEEKHRKAQLCHEEEFEHKVLKPTEIFKKELNEWIAEAEEESRNQQRAAEHSKGDGIADEAASENKRYLEQRASEYDELAKDGDNTKTSHDQKVFALHGKILKYK